MHATNQRGAPAARLARCSNSRGKRGWRNRYFQRNSRPDVSFVPPKSAYQPIRTARSFRFPSFGLASKTKLAANTWRQMSGRRRHSIFRVPPTRRGTALESLKPSYAIPDNRLIMNMRLGIEFRNGRVT